MRYVVPPGTRGSGCLGRVGVGLSGPWGILPFCVPFSYPKLVPFLEPNGKIPILGQLSFGSVFGTLRLQISAPGAPKRSFQGGGA